MPKLRVGLNAVFLGPERIGMATFVRALAAELVLAGDTELVVYCPPAAAAMLREREPWASEVQIVESPRAPSAVLQRPTRIGTELSWIAVRCRRDRLDVAHHTANVAPFARTVPSVMTIHDLMWRHFPSTHPRLSRVMLDALTPLAVRSVDRVATVSRYTADDVMATYGLKREQVETIPLGPGKRTTNGDALAARRRWNLDEGPVVLSIGHGFETKNVGRLIDAFARIGPARNATLVHVGAAIHEGGSWRAAAERGGVTGDVRFAGFDGPQLTDACLDDLYAAATVFVHPSLFEGFGLPVLEAMRRGVPVACSNATALPEVGGDAALYFDPYDVAQMADVTARLIDDPGAREAAIARGHQHVRAFSWQGTAAAYRDLYGRLAAHPARRSRRSRS